MVVGSGKEGDVCLAVGGLTTDGLLEGSAERSESELALGRTGGA